MLTCMQTCVHTQRHHISKIMEQKERKEEETEERASSH